MKEEKQNIDELIYLYLSGGANSEEIEKLQLWLKEDDQNLQYYTQLKTTWLLSLEGKNPHRFNTQKALLNFKHRIGFGRRLVPVFLRYAAIFIVAFGLGGILTYIVKPSANFSQEALSYNNEAEAPYGVRSKVNLPDGSQAWLNSGSKLIFPSVFAESIREVKLIGEGYFEVQTNPEKPFIVNANGVIVKATGTSFNVKSYPDESYVVTTLVEGKVSVIKENSEQEPIQLQPNEKITIYTDTRIAGRAKDDEAEEKEVIAKNMVLEKEVEIKKDISWREELWIIDDEPLETLAKKLERRYNVSINFMDSTMLKFRFTGTIKDESIDKVLNVISLTSPLLYKRSDNIIIFDIDEESKDKFRDDWQLN